MKTNTFTVCALLLWLASPALGQLPPAVPNPHAGLTQTIKTPWDHKDGTRYGMPQSIRDSWHAIQWGASVASPAAGGDPLKPVASNVIPVLIYSKDPHNPNSWRQYETDRLQFQPLGDNKDRLIWQFNTSDVGQWQFFVPAVKDATGKIIKSETYTVFLDVFERDHVNLFSRWGEYNYLSIGDSKGRCITIDGSLTINLGKSLAVDAIGGKLIVKEPLVVDRDGVKFLRVESGGKNYGLRLEPLD